MQVQYPNQSAAIGDPTSVYKRFKHYMECDVEDARKLDVPDFLKCTISDEIMKDPVIIQSGHTYEREMIEKHFRMVGDFDPVTRQVVDTNVLIPNHMLKKACEHYLAKNPWAYEHVMNEDYKDISMI